ncbi:MAG: phosphoglucomutase/phosphomannomutase family protein [Verrucomicrobia bacterium]|nr:phosphoglucomutase/phosphomannomutase family protein [Verrucomicrobiota bacterium]MBI3869277.1 phosphoglucomutase/phosphomannomutase family protein [Verrucomicrobiota bacterium]
MTPIKFGTDGWRAVIGEDFTFANLDRVAQATADHWQQHPVPGCERLVVVGYDRRFLSDEFGRRAAEILSANGFQVLLTSRPTPTPAVSYMVKRQRAVGGIMITASHNPPAFNGFKLKAHFGGSAESSLCQAIEAQLDRSPIRATPLDEAVRSRVIRVRDIQPAHFKALKRLVDFQAIARSPIRLAHDAMYGVGAGCFEELLAGTRCRVTTLNSAHDPSFGGINPEPITKNYAASSAWLRRHPQDLCVVTDGDADRVGGMDGHGRPVSTHQLICLLLTHFIKHRREKGRMVKALTATSMIEKICSEFGLECLETAVGFKYVAAEILKGGVLIGAEESGGIAFPGHVPERDGILAGLMLLEMLAIEKKPLTRMLAALEKRYGPHRYARIDTQFPLEKRAALMEFCKSNPPARLLRSPLADVKSYDGVKFVAQDGSWLMLRGSGTEPILRIYAEARSDADAAKLLKLGTRLTTQV